MADKTGIGWTEATWNPTTGCDRISAGCDHCYALKMAGRLKLMGSPKYQNDGDPRTSGPGFGVTIHPSVLDQPKRWTRPRMIFVNSMSDLFHARIPVSFVTEVFGVMAQTPRHAYQVLTKRSPRLTGVLARVYAELGVDEPLANVWIGTSIELDEHAGRAGDLRAAPAAIRFLSLEPLLGPLPSLDLTGIDWVIAGGESGQGHRPMDLGWVRDIRDRCVAAGIPFFFKQAGGITPQAGGRLLDGRTWDEFPEPRDAGNIGEWRTTGPYEAATAAWPATEYLARFDTTTEVEMAAMKAVREQAERAGDDPAAAVRREWREARKEWDQATAATRRTALAADLELQRRHPREQRELPPEAATLADGTPRADPFLAGRGWQAQGGLYVRREAEREREAS